KAGCVIVLWSPESIKSQWVKHEASQAIARGVYTPVRLEPMEIGSPFDRIQATDLFGWSGEPGDPGLLRLLRRGDELIPKPLSRIERASRFVRRNFVALASSIVAAAAIGILIQLSFGLDKQLVAMERALNPLLNLRIQARLVLDPNVQDVTTYIGR